MTSIFITRLATCFLRTPELHKRLIAKESEDRQKKEAKAAKNEVKRMEGGIKLKQKRNKPVRVVKISKKKLRIQPKKSLVNVAKEGASSMSD
jgi:hypothetical protein